MRARNEMVVAVAAAALFVTGVARAQNVQQRLDALEKKVDEGQKSVAELAGIEIHGLVATNYNYNFNDPDSGRNRIHVFDDKANSFSLDQANINIQRKVPAGIGFNIDVDFGRTAEVVGGSTRWGSGQNNRPIDLRQAYVSYAFPDSPFSIEAGKFVTFHGAEVIKAYNNINYNISNSILFGFAIPFTHTGFLGTYTLPNSLGSLTAGVVNGWDNVSDDNSGKSVTSMFTLTPDPMFTFALSTTYGPEEDDNGRSKRLLVTPLFTVKPTDQLTFILDYNYGTEGNTAPGLRTVMWQGAAAYAVFAMNDWQFALRGEVFDDPDGFKTGANEAGFGPGATFWEFTPTVSYKITEGLTARAEFRHDESDKRFFDKHTYANGNTLNLRGQDLIATELIYAF